MHKHLPFFMLLSLFLYQSVWASSAIAQVQVFEDSASSAYARGDYRASIRLYVKAAEIAATLSDSDKLFKHMRNAQNIALKSAEFDSAVALAQHEIQLLKQIKPIPTDKLVDAYNRGGTIAIQAARYRTSEKLLNRNLELCRQFNLTGKELAIAYNSLALLASHQDDFDNQLSYQKQAIAIIESNESEPSIDLAIFYNNLANVYGNLKMQNERLAAAQHSLKIKLKFAAPDRITVIIGYNNLGKVYLNQLEPEVALQKLGIAKAQLDKQGLTDNTLYGSLLSNIAEAHAQLNHFELAETYHLRSSEIRLKKFGQRHPKYCESLLNIASVYEAMGQPKKAIELIQQSLIAGNFTFTDTNFHQNPGISSSVSQSTQLKGLTDKAELYFNHARSFPKPVEALKTGLIAIDSAIVLLDDIRRGIRNEASVQLLGENSSKIYELAIQLSLSVLRITGDSTYTEHAFNYAERSKGFMLSLNAFRKEAQKFAGIPAELTRRENDLIAEVRRLESILPQIIKKQQAEKERSLRQDLLDARRKLNAIEKNYLANYSNYHDLRFNRFSRQTMTKAKSCGYPVLSFYIGESQLYLFSIINGALSIETKPIDSLKTELIKFFNLIQSPPDLNNTAGEAQSYQAVALGLFQKLIAQNLKKIISEQPENHSSPILIIPDGLLSYLPFDLLVASLREKPEFSSLDYLLNHIQAMYSYSLEAHFKKGKKSNNKKACLGMAPVYTEIKSSNGQGGLSSNIAEIEQIEQVFSGTFARAYEATEAFFKQNAFGFNLIHLAAHGYASDLHPGNSFLLFSQNDDNENDTLFAHEVYEIEMQPQLLVLSACETGQGILAKGEGIQSIARAFQFAGAENMIMSLWTANDEANAAIFKHFYSGLDKNKTIGRALNEAKQNYLNNANSLTSHPYFWAGINLIGRDDQISLAGGLDSTILLTGAILALMLLGYWLTFRNSKRAFHKS